MSSGLITYEQGLFFLYIPGGKVFPNLLNACKLSLVPSRLSYIHLDFAFARKLDYLGFEISPA